VALIGRQEWRVVGIVGNVRHGALEQEAGMEMYFPITQVHDAPAVELVVRARLPVETFAPSVRAALRMVDPNLPTGNFRTLEQLVDQAVSPRRFVMLLLGGFALLALVLASLGIYGVISYSVNQRTNELGIRMALGAQAADVLRLVTLQGMKPALAGTIIGLGAAFALTRVMSTLLFGVKATDPTTYAGIALLLIGVAWIACFIPARRAASVDPIVALRHE
jgi:predicted lysophospholipase L1 biosynthesis ABC-type transport system permease subunit